MPDARTPEDFFAGSPQGLALLRTVRDAIAEVGPSTVVVTKSQIAFRRRTGFAYLWVPGRYVRNDAPAVISIALPGEVRSPRFKEVAHPSPRWWMHHLELHEPAEVDAEVRAWLAQAHAAAG